jgi:methionyl-tRNA formyltransferase
MRMVKALDAGPMLATARRPIGLDDTSEEVEHDLARIGAALSMSTVDGLAAGPVAEVPQDESAATYARRITREDATVDWASTADAIHNLIRGLHPWPHAHTFHRDRRLILLRSRTEPLEPSSHAPGTILEASGDRLHITTGGGVLAITQIQAEGRRPMTPREFLAGYRLAAGEILSSHR